jgi:hypothetical protein
MGIKKSRNFGSYADERLRPGFVLKKQRMLQRLTGFSDPAQDASGNAHRGHRAA